MAIRCVIVTFVIIYIWVSFEWLILYWHTPVHLTKNTNNKHTRIVLLLSIGFRFQFHTQYRLYLIGHHSLRLWALMIAHHFIGIVCAPLWLLCLHFSRFSFSRSFLQSLRIAHKTELHGKEAIKHFAILICFDFVTDRLIENIYIRFDIQCKRFLAPISENTVWQSVCECVLFLWIKWII